MGVHLLMANLGSVGRFGDYSPRLMAGPSPFWFSPLNRAVVTRNDGIRGPQPFRLGRANGSVAVDEVTAIVGSASSGGYIYVS